LTKVVMIKANDMLLRRVILVFSTVLLYQTVRKIFIS